MIISFLMSLANITIFMSMAFIFKDRNIWVTEVPIGIVGAVLNLLHLFICPFFHSLLNDEIPGYDEQYNESTTGSD